MLGIIICIILGSVVAYFWLAVDSMGGDLGMIAFVCEVCLVLTISFLYDLHRMHKSKNTPNE